MIRRAFMFAAVVALGAAAGCSKSNNGTQGPNRGPIQVGYVVVQPTAVPVQTLLGGRTVAYETSEVRPQVNGLIRRRYFTEGSYVRQGQPLFQIDPSLYQASVDQAAANVAAAQATAEAAHTKAERYRPLAAVEAVSKQDYTDAAAQARQARATVNQNAAALRTARINLRFTSIPAPISGRIGRSLFTVGALVTASQTDALATITRLDPIYVDIQQSAADLVALRRALAKGGVVPSVTQVRLKLPDGSDYGYMGTVQFGEVIVTEGTGSVTLRARFPNPQSVLFPGMFVKASFAQAVDTTAFLVPQAAVSRDPKGNATVWLVGAGNKAVQRAVVADRTQGSYWVVTQGLAAGEKVITQGISNLRDRAAITPVPATTPQRIQAPSAGAAKAGQSGR